MSDCSPNNCVFLPSPGTPSGPISRGRLVLRFGALLLRGIDRQIGLTERLTAAIQDKRHQSYIDHPLRDLLAHASIKSLRGMQTPMTPIVFAGPLVQTWGRAATPGYRPAIWPVAPTFSRLEHHIPPYYMVDPEVS